MYSIKMHIIRLRKVLIILTINFVFSIAQNENYDVFDFNGEDDFVQTHQFSNGYTQSGLNNALLNFLPGSSQKRKQSSFDSPCESYFSYQKEPRGETFGTISIPNPDHNKVVIRTVFSVAARLPTVSFFLTAGLKDIESF